MVARLGFCRRSMGRHDLSADLPCSAGAIDPGDRPWIWSLDTVPGEPLLEVLRCRYKQPLRRALPPNLRCTCQQANLPAGRRADAGWHRRRDDLAGVLL